MSVTHAKVSPAPASPDPAELGGPDWNDPHKFSGGTHGALLLRDTGAADGASWGDLATVVGALPPASVPQHLTRTGAVLTPTVAGDTLRALVEDIGGQIYNVKAFREDGDASWSEAIQRAIDFAPGGDIVSGDRGVAVYLPPGAFDCLAKIRMRMGVRLFGAGQNATRILSDVVDDDLIYYDADSTDPALRKTIQLHDFVVVGRVVSSGAYIHITGSASNSSPTLRNIIVTGADKGAVGVRVKSTIQALFDMVYVTHCTGDGFVMEAPNNLVTFAAPYSADNGGHGFNVVAAEVTMINPGADSNVGDGFHLEVNALTMTSPEGEDNHAAQLRLYHGSSVTILSPMLYGSSNSVDGIVIDATTEVALIRPSVLIAGGTPSGYALKLLNAPTGLSFWGTNFDTFGSGLLGNAGGALFTVLTSTGALGIKVTSFPGGAMDVEGQIWVKGAGGNTPMDGLDVQGGNGFYGIRVASDHSVNIDVYNGGSPLAALKVLQNGAVMAPASPTYADDAAASGLAAGTLYKTATGELRIKL